MYPPPPTPCCPEECLPQSKQWYFKKWLRNAKKAARASNFPADVQFPTWLDIAYSWLRECLNHWLEPNSLRSTLLLPSASRQSFSWRLCFLIMGQESKGQKQVQPTRANWTVWLVKEPLPPPVLTSSRKREIKNHTAALPSTWPPSRRLGPLAY